MQFFFLCLGLGMADPASDSAPPADSTSSSLILGIKANDAEAWKRLVDLYSPLVYRWCRRRVSQQAAVDLLQRVFLAVFEGIPRFRHDLPEDTFRGWLWTITRNKIVDYLRQRSGRPLAVSGTPLCQMLDQIPAPGSSASGTPPVADELVRHAIEQVQAEFEPRTWQAFWLTAIDGFQCSEVAAELGMTPAAVRNAKYKVRRRFLSVLSTPPTQGLPPDRDL